MARSDRRITSQETSTAWHGRLRRSISTSSKKGLRIMFRKIGILAAAGVAGLVLVSWAGLGSYCTTAWHNITHKIKGQVPLEFEIQRVRQQVADLVPDMHNQCRTVAEEMVAVKNLRTNISEAQVRLAQDKDRILAMSKALESGNETVTYRGDEYS